MSYLLFAWIASITSALIAITAKLTTRYGITNPWLFNFLWSLIIVAFVIPFAIANHAGFPNNFLPIFLAGVSGALFYILYVLALYRLDVSVMSPLFNFRTIFAVILGIAFFNENFSFYQCLLASVIIVAGVFATVDEKLSLKSFFNPSVGLGILAMAFLSVNSVALKWAASFDDIWTINLWEAVVSLIVTLPTLKFFYKDIFKVQVKQIIPIAVMGLLQTVTNFALTSALAINVGITSIIMSIPLSMVLAFIFSIFAPELLEKHSLKTYFIRFTAATVMIVSALQLSR